MNSKLLLFSLLFSPVVAENSSSTTTEPLTTTTTGSSSATGANTTTAPPTTSTTEAPTTTTSGTGGAQGAGNTGGESSSIPPASPQHQPGHNSPPPSPNVGPGNNVTNSTPTTDSSATTQVTVASTIGMVCECLATNALVQAAADETCGAVTAEVPTTLAVKPADFSATCAKAPGTTQGTCPTPTGGRQLEAARRQLSTGELKVLATITITVPTANEAMYTGDGSATGSKIGLMNTQIQSSATFKTALINKLNSNTALSTALGAGAFNNLTVATVTSSGTAVTPAPTTAGALTTGVTAVLAMAVAALAF